MRSWIRTMATLKEFLSQLVEDWDSIAIRAFQDGRWQSLFLAEITDSKQIVDWIASTKGRFYD